MSRGCRCPVGIRRPSVDDGRGQLVREAVVIPLRGVVGRLRGRLTPCLGRGRPAADGVLLLGCPPRGHPSRVLSPLVPGRWPLHRWS